MIIDIILYGAYNDTLVAPPAGIEPTTSRLTAVRSTN
jgi:hypothetical protein